MRKVCVRGTLVSAALALSACSTIYLHDPSLKQSATKAHDALAGVAPLKPFDDQLANLKEFAGREDLAVANYWTSVRDKHLMSLLALPDIRRDAQMNLFANKRLADLLGRDQATPVNYDRFPGMSGRLAMAAEHKASLGRLAASARREYLSSWHEAQSGKKSKEPPKPPDLACPKVLAMSEGERAELAAAVEKNGKLLIEELYAACEDARGRTTAADAIFKELLSFKVGIIGQVAEVAAEAEAKTETKLSEHASRLEAVAKDAEKYDGVKDGLELFRVRIHKVLEGASEATKFAGWDEVDGTLNQMLRTVICEAPDKTVKEETKTEAKCGEIVPQSGAGRAGAAWGVLKALAQLQDANAAQRRSANWLLAVKIVVAAEKADAKLVRAAAEAKRVASRQRLDALIVETANLVTAVRWLEPRGAGGAGTGDCIAGLGAANRPANRHCAHAGYVTAWNNGRIPSEVLRYRAVQTDRQYAVMRARVVAEKQYGLATAGSATLKEYAEGGIVPSTLAQAALDIASAGIVSAGDN